MLTPQRARWLIPRYLDRWTQSFGLTDWQIIWELVPEITLEGKKYTATVLFYQESKEALIYVSIARLSTYQALERSVIHELCHILHPGISCDEAESFVVDTEYYFQDFHRERRLAKRKRARMEVAA